MSHPPFRRVVVNLVGDHVHGRLAESRFDERLFVYGGELSMYQLAFAGAKLGYETELRGWIDRAVFEAFALGAGAKPRVELPARRPRADDLVIVPEGWTEPLDYARLALSPAHLMLYVLAAPGLFGWPFVAEPWDAPDPLTVPLDAVARPEHFSGMAALGFRLLTHSPGLVEAAAAGGAECTLIGSGIPGWRAPQMAEKTVDVLALEHNRWAPLADGVLDELEGLTVDRVEEVDNHEMLARMARARTLVWPSRIEGHASIPWEARSVGCVPVALSSNRFAVGLDEEHGAVLVDRPNELAPAVRRLLSDPPRWEHLSQLGRDTAPAEVAWEPFVERVGAALEADWPDDPLRAPLAGFGQALGAWLGRCAAEAQARLEEKGGELAAAAGDLTAATENQEHLLSENARLQGELDRRSVRAVLRVANAIRRRA